MTINSNLYHIWIYLFANVKLAHEIESECVGPEHVCDFSFPSPANLDVFVWPCESACAHICFSVTLCVYVCVPWWRWVWLVRREQMSAAAGCQGDWTKPIALPSCPKCTANRPASNNNLWHWLWGCQSYTHENTQQHPPAWIKPCKPLEKMWKIAGGMNKMATVMWSVLVATVA